MAFTEDHSVFFDDSDFAESVRIDGVPIMAIVDNDYYDEIMESRRPVALLEEAKLPTITQDVSTLTRVKNGVVYTIKNVEPDGTGQVLLKLHKQ